MRQVASNTEEVKDWFRVEMENSGGFDWVKVDKNGTNPDWIWLSSCKLIGRFETEHIRGLRHDGEDCGKLTQQFSNSRLEN